MKKQKRKKRMQYLDSNRRRQYDLERNLKIQIRAFEILSSTKGLFFQHSILKKKKDLKHT